MTHAREARRRPHRRGTRSRTSAAGSARPPRSTSRPARTGRASCPACRRSRCPPAGARSHRGGRVAFELGGVDVERLLAIGRSEGCTPFVTLLAAYAALLSRLAGREEFAIGTVVANRDRAELQDVI